jgi:hypothetical protein
MELGTYFQVTPLSREVKVQLIETMMRSHLDQQATSSKSVYSTKLRDILGQVRLWMEQQKKMNKVYLIYLLIYLTREY